MLLAIYLNDHLAGSTVGRELARRSAASNRGTSYGSFLERLAAEITEDREALLAIMRALEVKVDPLKVAFAWGAEKVGRLKLNGRILGYSPLSRVVELEALSLGVAGKLAGWQALALIEPAPLLGTEIDLDELRRRAERQLAELETNRKRAAAEAFA